MITLLFFQRPPLAGVAVGWADLHVEVVPDADAPLVCRVGEVAQHIALGFDRIAVSEIEARILLVNLA
jgi:hypothetical protein